MKLTTNLERIEHLDYAIDFKKLKSKIENNKSFSSNNNFNITEILETLGPDATIWCLNSTIEDSTKLIEKIAIKLAFQILFIHEKHYPDDGETRKQLNLLQNKIDGIDADYSTLLTWNKKPNLIFFGRFNSGQQSKLAIIYAFNVIQNGEKEDIIQVLTYSISTLYYYYYKNIRTYKNKKKELLNIITKEVKNYVD